jgi:hypothetical protein
LCLDSSDSNCTSGHAGVRGHKGRRGIKCVAQLSD